MTKSGTIVYFSSGSYSDYGIHGFGKALIDFDYDDQKKIFNDAHPDTEEPIPAQWYGMRNWGKRDGSVYRKGDTYTVSHRSIDKFILWLTQQGIIEDIEVEEFYED